MISNEIRKGEDCCCFTQPGVRMGLQAGSSCCVNLESATNQGWFCLKLKKNFESIQIVKQGLFSQKEKNSDRNKHPNRLIRPNQEESTITRQRNNLYTWAASNSSWQRKNLPIRHSTTPYWNSSRRKRSRMILKSGESEIDGKPPGSGFVEALLNRRASSALWNHHSIQFNSRSTHRPILWALSFLFPQTFLQRDTRPLLSYVQAGLSYDIKN